MRHLLSALVQNVPGVLAHISGMLASRGYNIDSLAVGATENPELSRMTFVVVGDDRVLEQVRKQLEKIVTVVQVHDISSQDFVERDLMLIKVKAAPGGPRTEVRELVEIFRGKIVDVGADELMIELSGRENKIDASSNACAPMASANWFALDAWLWSAPVNAFPMKSTQLPQPASNRFPKSILPVRRVLRQKSTTERTMTAKIYYDNDADLSHLKDKTIAILGYGSQGHAQAQNLRDSGCNVIIGQRPGSPNYDLAVSHKFKPMSIEEAVKQADVVNILLPDEVQGDIFKQNIRPISRRAAF